MQDVQFLALLVHRGHLGRGDAEQLLRELEQGAALDRLLVERLAWSGEQVARMRRTRAGEIPELPGFEILEKLGTGGTADVFKAREKRTQRLVALKVLNQRSTAHAATRKAFIAEARLLERLDHPNLVRCHGVARSGNTFFSKLELIEGRTVLEMLDAGHVFDEESTLRIALGAAEALCYLERNAVVHRDVKPGNLMIDRDGRVVLIDLGFAAEAEAPCNAEGSAVGTVAYLSPEQAQGGASADCRSDIYSLGISLFHIVVGRLPFESSDDCEILRMQIMESLSSAELRTRGISPHLHYFLEKMVAKEAGDRYQSWAELIADVREQLAGRADLDFEEGARAPRAPRGSRGPRGPRQR